MTTSHADNAQFYRSLTASDGAARLAAAKAAIMAGTTLDKLAARTDSPVIDDYPKLAPAGELAEGYVALGYQGGVNYIWSTQRRCVVPLDGNAVNSVMLETYGGAKWLYATYGEKTADGGTKINLGRARSELIAACQRAGIYRPTQVMGAGVWMANINGVRQLVCNSGGDVFNADGTTLPRASKFAVFAEGRETGITANGPTLTDADVAELSAALETWNWANPSDGALMLGWLALSPFSGAISRRPIFAVQSPPKCGKSVLTEFCGNLLGAGRVNVIGAQTTVAGITDQLQADSVPVLLDEIFAAEGASKRDQERVNSLMVLLRTAFGSGSDGIAKGTKDGRVGGAMYTTRFCSFIASRTFPSMDDQDRSRMVHCRLLPRDSRARSHRLLARPEQLPELGDRMRNSMFQHWSAFEETYGNVHEVFTCQLGLDARMAETLGQLIAAWYVITQGIAADLATAAMLVRHFDLTSHIERVSGRSDERDCADWLMGYRPKNSAHALGEVMRRVRDGDKDGGALLEEHGVKLSGEYAQVCASAVISGLRDVFAGSPYAGGRWDALLGNAPGAKSTNPRFAGKTMRAVAIPLSWLFDEPADPKQGELL